MFENFPYIPPWRIIVLVLGIAGFFAGDWFFLEMDTLQPEMRDGLVKSTVQQALYADTPAVDTPRSQIEAVYGSGREAIPGVVKKGQPNEIIYSIAWGKELRVNYSPAGTVLSSSIFYYSDGVYVPLLATGTSDEDYYAATSLLRENVYYILLKPIVVLVLAIFLGLYLILSLPRIRRWINRNNPPKLPIGVPVKNPKDEEVAIIPNDIPPGQRPRIE